MDRSADRNAADQFYTTALETRLTRHLRSAPAAAAAALCRDAAAHVPAYSEFLQHHGIDGAAADAAAFADLPLVTKDNYIRRYDLPARCRDGRLAACDMLAVSSGSTGRPTVWPRALRDELDVAYRFEQVFRDAFDAARRDTLAVICFPMGTWVGGMYTAACCRHLAHKGYPVTVSTPGNKPEEILRVVTELGPHFQQVVLLGYPPFVKDVIDAGLAAGVEWARYRIRLVFAGEVFTEEWRGRVCERAGAPDPCRDTAALYGTADAGVLGNETAASIAVRRFLADRPDAARALFGESRLPTLVQYDPMSRYFEVVNGTLAVTADGGTPLLRYHIADQGGIVAYSDMLQFLVDHGADPETLLPAGPHGRYALPFVYVFGRADFTLSYYGANVYPENVAVGLEQPSLAGWVSGKFVMSITEPEAGPARLALAVELLPGVAPGEEIAAAVVYCVTRELRRLNSEFANYVPEEHQPPLVSLHPTGDPEYFPHGVKHRYTRR